MRSTVVRILFGALAVLLVAGCTVQPAPAPAVVPTQVQVAERPTQTPYPTASPYPTYTPFPTLTVLPTFTPTAMATLTPTVSAAATSVLAAARALTTTRLLTTTVKPVALPATPKPVAPQPVGSAELWRTPGSYSFTPQCAAYTSSFGGRGWKENFCLIKVEVYPEVMRFYGVWHITLISGVFKSRFLYHPKSTSAAYYVVDNLGNKYIHARTGGVADADTVVQQQDYTMGYDDENHHPDVPISWWEFQPARPNASSFIFYDDEHGVRVGPIVLSKQ